MWQWNRLLREVVNSSSSSSRGSTAGVLRISCYGERAGLDDIACPYDFVFCPEEKRVDE